MVVTRIKICGITRIEDALAAVKAGADAIGLVFFAASPRAITLDQASQICAALPPFITTVGLFVNASYEEVSTISSKLSLGLLQFHGDESPEYCEQFKQPWIKALRVQPTTNIVAIMQPYNKAQGILLDSYVAGIQGGTGTTFDWSLIPQQTDKPIILAGGLTVENVQQAIQIAKPYAVDVSGGVEVTKGIKDHNKMKAFINKVRSSL
ncbi:phosphoribosylanthranilate isomerase [Entomomonas asaccharolytica]|uniref:N-(5'-phosphoribosyl)anthranilate isomerase n=1 Tax=Entomomonas asaccharolytica TaxID=2785331 RepID=A0A974RYD4_9GAMM|nr:phosphoribosylanthranilate isomerase [Entomomonas asaccharolytica]QQP87168.1 phosphoribosylanthranilate isomerase [Entomomonas asaccharolytica]